MFVVNPAVEEPYRIAAIDPGTNTLGISFIDVDLKHRTITVVDSTTYRADSRVKEESLIYETRGDRAARLHFHYHNFGALLRQFQPHAVIAESPFMGRFPAAFEALCECREMLRRAVADYNPTIPLELVDPPTAKKAVGALVQKGSKENVRDSVLALKDLRWALPYPIELLDEHCYDSIACGYFLGKLVLAGYVHVL